MEPDFSLMYSELGLSPGCGLEEFQRAYRRRIAELHPDRKGGVPPSHEAQTELAALISTHAAVSRFHHRYGRMPGAPARPAAPGQTGNDPPPAAPTSRTSLPVSVSMGGDPEPSTRPTWRLVIVFLALLALMATWDWLTIASQ